VTARQAIVTGAAGFIGSTLVDRLLGDGWRVTGIDDFSTGQRRFLDSAAKCSRFSLVEADLLDPAAAVRAVRGAEIVFHLAANADVRFGTEHPRKDVEQNTIVTSNVLEAMRESGIRHIAFTSTGSVYGESPAIPTPENAPFPVQTSLYGASKLAAEGLIQAYCEGFGFTSWIFRLVSSLGTRYTHGHVVDFYRQLRADPARLTNLGNGRQRKSYIDVDDCVAGMLTGVARADGRVNILNIGSAESCEVRESAAWIAARMGVTPDYVFGEGDRGWIGDNPVIVLDARRLTALGWSPSRSIRESVERTVDFLRDNEWVLEAT
jgi:UDP-glucose 4-epimerase